MLQRLDRNIHRTLIRHICQIFGRFNHFLRKSFSGALAVFVQVVCLAALRAPCAVFFCYTLAQGIQASGEFDLILCGRQTTDGDTAQVGPEISEWLNIPSVADVVKINKIEEDGITVSMDLPGEVEIAKVMFPCLLAVNKDIFQPRLPSCDAD